MRRRSSKLEVEFDIFSVATIRPAKLCADGVEREYFAFFLKSDLMMIFVAFSLPTLIGSVEVKANAECFAVCCIMR